MATPSKTCAEFDVDGVKALTYVGTTFNVVTVLQKIERFRRARPRDWNLACGVSKVASRKQFARYAAASMTRLITETDHRSVLGDPPLEIFEVEKRPLQAILEDSPFRGRQIDFLNIDCEGSDLEVLESLDLDRLLVIAKEFLDTFR